MDPARLLVKGPSPINLRMLEHLLRSYPRFADREYLQDGFKCGFHIPYVGPRTPFMAGNLRSVVALEVVVRQKIQKELREGRVLGPFVSPPLPNLRMSPLVVVPKKGSGEYRLIHHLLYPRGSSVNDRIPEHLSSVWYTSFNQAVAMVHRCRPRAWMAKAHIKSAFWLLPDEFHLLGFSFDGLYFMDRALPIGCSISCSAFERFSPFLEWALR